MKWEGPWVVLESLGDPSEALQRCIRSGAADAKTQSVHLRGGSSKDPVSLTVAASLGGLHAVIFDCSQPPLFFSYLSALWAFLGVTHCPFNKFLFHLNHGWFLLLAPKNLEYTDYKVGVEEQNL